MLFILTQVTWDFQPFIVIELVFADEMKIYTAIISRLLLKRMRKCLPAPYQKQHRQQQKNRKAGLEERLFSW